VQILEFAALLRDAAHKMRSFSLSVDFERLAQPFRTGTRVSTSAVCPPAAPAS